MSQAVSHIAQVAIDYSWSFSDKTRTDTTYITHGYHRYPAKFIPQLASRLLTSYSKEGDLVVDPFYGCGTTLVEAKVMGRPSIGADINPVAALIARAKTTCIQPKILDLSYIKLLDKLNSYSDKMESPMIEHERIDYWFRFQEKKKLSFVLNEILIITNSQIRDFFLCGFSNILKNCSIWLQKSNKPTRDLNKQPSDPIQIFIRQINQMIKGNHKYFLLLNNRKYLDIKCDVYCTDARNIPTESGSVSLIVTSPPYVTSYEYADLHQLTAFWLGYTDDLSSFRKKFIGTTNRDKSEKSLNSKLAEEIVLGLEQKDKNKSAEVANYFKEMNQVFMEMKRILKVGGKTCIVIGNTNLKGIPILNAEVFTEQLLNIGFIVRDIIKREIPSKNLPSIRDEITGKFAKLDNENKVSVYPTEYILVMEKQNDN